MCDTDTRNGQRAPKKEARENSEAGPGPPHKCQKPHGRNLWARFCNFDAFALLNAECKNIEKIYRNMVYRAIPIGFYAFGIYPTFFRRQRELAEQKR